MAYETLLTQKDGPIFKVTINRADQLNALNEACVRELTDVFKTLASDKSVRIVTIEGAGTKAFVAGADIKAMSNMSADEAFEFARRGQKLSALMAEAPQVVIGKVRGFALGGGCELAMACDLVIATKSSKFAQPEVNLGIIPGFGGTQRLVRRVGLPRALDILLCGKAYMVPAETAWQMGLVSRVVEDDQLEAVTKQMTDAILAAGPEAVRATKELTHQAVEMSLEAGLQAEAHAFSRCFARTESKEGTSAFVEKRAPNFK